MFENYNLDEYLDPDLYDMENRDSEPDASFLLALARETGGPLLDLGCGTGRLTIPLAQDGFEVVGLDIVPEMLAHAREKASGLPITWVEGDVRTFALDRQFKLIFEGGAVFMHQLSNADQVAYLERVRAHLAPGGRVVLCVFFPQLQRLETNLEEQEWFSYTDEQGRAVRVSGFEEYDALRQVKIETAVRRITGPDGVETVRTAPLSLRYTFPQEMEALLAHAGFRVVERYGGLDRSPLAPDSRLMVYVFEAF